VVTAEPAALPAERYGTPAIARLDPALLEDLADHYRQAQREQLRALATRHAFGPHLRQAEDRLTDGELLEASTIRLLAADAARDAQARETQQQRRLTYLDFRAPGARRRARNQPLTKRRRHGAETHLGDIDHEYLRACGSCAETSYPVMDGLACRAPHQCGFSGRQLDSLCAGHSGTLPFGRSM
jgi:hypothetical protein